MRRLSIVFLCLASAGALADPAPDAEWGQEVYTENCRNCHGPRGQAKALGRSRPLRELTTEEVVEHLLSYQLPHDGHSMQDRIKSSLGEQDIHDVAAYIATLADQ